MPVDGLAGLAAQPHVRLCRTWLSVFTGAVIPVTSCGLHCISRNALHPLTLSCIDTPFVLLLEHVSGLAMLMTAHRIRTMQPARGFVLDSTSRPCARSTAPLAQKTDARMILMLVRFKKLYTIAWHVYSPSLPSAL